MHIRRFTFFLGLLLLPFLGYSVKLPNIGKGLRMPVGHSQSGDEETNVSQNTKGTKDITHSVLATGSWFKIRISKSGIYKITYSDLQKMGFPLDGNSADIALYGNGGGILPEVNNAPRPSGLTENPIVVMDGGDGKMNPGDYILFYGQGPVVWNYNTSTGHFSHQDNYYDNYAYYFLTLKSTPGKRIQTEATPAGTPDMTVNTFTDFAYHGLDEENLGGTGRTWYGEVYDFTTSYQFNFDFPNIVDTAKVYVDCSFASNAASSNSFSVYADGNLERTVNIPLTTPGGYDVGKAGETMFEFIPSSSTVTIKTDFNRSDASAIGYLDYIDVNARRNLIFSGNQMPFTCIEKSGTLAQYNLVSADSVKVWEITNPLDAQEMALSRSGNNYSFETAVAPLKSFIAFNDKGYLSPEFVGTVDNQDLHYGHNIDYLIVSAPEFLSQAERLATYHEQKDHMTVYVTTPQKIYNEFSSGAQDITAIRDFVKRIYDQSDSGKKLKYLLLFGDASYDYKDRVTDNTNFVPCWESLNSLNTINSIASDDYYGYLEDGEGTGTNDKVDIGIGRFPVDNLTEATEMVDKVIAYDKPSPKNMGPWRNLITFSADDGDYNTHLNDAQTLSKLVQAQDPVYNQNKLYLDAFPQISTPGGQLAPAMNAAIDEDINKGTLIFNYSGHGGEEGLGQERFLTFSDINSWTNYNKLTVFITATCEFTRFDNPKLVSAGERVFLSDQGGAIALFTTTRATYASSNLALNSAIYNHNLFEKVDGQYPRFGDVIRRSKVLGGDNDKKFVLIGDPALRLAYPEYKAQTTKIDSKAVVENVPDTLQALATVRIQGEVEDSLGNVLSHYNGTLYPTVYDKASVVTTLGTDADSPVTTFKLWKNVLFNGQTDITNGRFDFSFVVPKDIAYSYGPGRISYYFNNDTTDGQGYSQNIVVGGYDENAVQDTTGPEIRLFLNDSTFSAGNITDANPVLYALISDLSGINTTGTGIGHDIVATLDNNASESYDLNNYYVADKGDFTKGSLKFPLQGLTPGKHTLSLKVWDIYNNSSTATINFIVVPSSQLVVKDLKNYPNPFTIGTNFVFDHNQAGKTLNLEINIYQLDGQKIKTIKRQIQPSGFSSGPIYWNGDTDRGGKIGRGVYIYILTVKTTDGQLKTEQSKLVYLR
ncbi:MAG: type IX secretion system sortase PorU [Bacteroidales bacterium]|nr:type IX secretion system sortase PorU [Bacteroidales bacterium]